MLRTFNQDSERFRDTNNATVFGDQGITMGLLRSFVKTFYDLQAVRMALGNRIAAQWGAKIYGRKAGEKTEVALARLHAEDIAKKREIDELGLPEEDAAKRKQEIDELKVLKLVVADYQLLTKVYAKRLPTITTFRGSELISSFGEWAMVHQFMEMLNREKKTKEHIAQLTEQHPLYQRFSINVPGFGALGTAVLLSYINIHKAMYVSSIWAYLGLDVMRNGHAPSRKEEGLIKVPYFDNKGEFKTKSSVTYNPWLRARFLGALMPCLVKRKEGYYRDMYLDFKHGRENQPGFWSETSKLHRHRDAMRRMSKQFIADIYPHWRESFGLPVFDPYSEAKLGISHSTDQHGPVGNPETQQKTKQEEEDGDGGLYKLV